MNKNCWDCIGKDANKLPCLNCNDRDIDDCRCKKLKNPLDGCDGVVNKDEELRQVVETYKEFQWINSRELPEEVLTRMKSFNKVNNYDNIKVDKEEK